MQYGNIASRINGAGCIYTEYARTKHTYTSHKKFSKGKQAHVGMERSKPTEQDGNNTTTHTHHPYILCHFANYVLCLLVVCIGGLRKVVGRVLLCVVHVDVHGVCCAC